MATKGKTIVGIREADHERRRRSPVKTASSEKVGRRNGGVADTVCRKYLSVDGDRRIGLPRASLCDRIRSGLDDLGICVIVAMAGMGKTELLRQVLACERGAGLQTFMLDLHGRRDDSLLGEVEAFARAARKGLKLSHVTVAFDGVCSLDEVLSTRFGKAICSLTSRGARVLVAMRPEAESASDFLPSYMRLGSSDLLLGDEEAVAWLPRLTDAQRIDLLRAAHGIPSIVRAFGLERLQSGNLALSARALEAVHRCVSDTLESPRPHEERILMAAMTLLGTGSLDDLMRMGIRADQEMALEYARCYPVFGVNPFDRSFLCVATNRQALESACAVLKEDAPELVTRVFRELLRRERYEDVLYLASRFLEREDRFVLACEHPFELANAGGLGFIRLATEGMPAPSDRKHGASCDQVGFDAVRTLLSCLLESSLRTAEEDLSTLEEDVDFYMLAEQATPQLRLIPPSGFSRLGSTRRSVLAEQARLLVLLRRQWEMPSSVSWREAFSSEAGTAGGGQGSDMTTSVIIQAAGLLASPSGAGGRAVAADPVVRGLRLLICCFELAAACDFTGICRLMIAAGADLGATSVLSAALRRLYTAASALCGDASTAVDLAADSRAARLLSLPGLEPVARRFTALSEASKAYCGTAAPDALETLLADAARASDRLAGAVLTFALGVQDVRRRSLSRALVRSEQLRETAASAGLHVFVRLSWLLEALVKVEAGSFEAAAAGLTEALWSGTDRRDQISLLASYFAAALSLDEGRIANFLRDLEGKPCPAAAAPLVVLMLHAVEPLIAAHNAARDVSAGEELSSEDLIPSSWAAALEPYRRARAEQEAAWTPAAHLLLAAAEDYPFAARPEVRMKISVLGQFDVSLDGYSLYDKLSRRKKALALVCALAISRKHTLTRDEACHLLWPGSDASRARESYYHVVSFLRKLLNEGLTKEDAVLVTGIGFVRLNVNALDCDVDRFEQTAREVIGHRARGADSIGLCEELIEIVQGESILGGMFESAAQVRARLDELDRLYVDALSLGAQQALRVGMERDAVWLARCALMVDGLRDDVVKILMSANMRLGDYKEAQLVYEAYIARMVHDLSSPPSAELRDLYREVCERLGIVRKQGARLKKSA